MVQSLHITEEALISILVGGLMITYSNPLEKTITFNTYPLEYINDIYVQFNCNLSLTLDDFIITEIGYCRLSLVDMDKFKERLVSYDIINALSNHTAYIVKEAIVNNIDTKTLAIIDIISIDEDFKRRGFGGEFLDFINNYLIGLNIGIGAIGLVSGWNSKDNTWLNEFYKQKGFAEYSKTKDNRSLMIKRLG